MLNYLTSRIRSFKFAFRGLAHLFLEPNFRIHLIALIFVVSLSFYFSLSNIEWLIVLLSIALVLVAEAVNTAIEKLIDFITLEPKKEIARIKDMSAAFVLIAAINAVVIGSIIFIPKLLLKF